MLVHSFPPAITPGYRVLILGSIPGKRSLEMQAYYAHPKNLFWSFIADIFNIPPETGDYEKLRLLKQQHIGICDVLKKRIHISSLDSDIEEASIVANDFSALFAEFPHIQHLFFNGSKAEQAFRRHVLKQQTIPAHLHYHKLPSSSPANASIKKEHKLAQWQQITSVIAG